MRKAGTAIESTRFSSLDDLRAACLDLPSGDLKAAAVAAERQGQLTKPPGSLGRLEDVVVWLAQWQGRSMPRLDHVDILVFAGNHGVTAQGVSAYPAEVTAQMVANFSAGGAAINQLARTVGATLHVVPLALEQPTADFTQTLAMNEDAFLAAVGTGYNTVSSGADLVCLGEMGIGNTTAAPAPHSGVARWLRLRSGGRPVGKTACRRARARLGGACLGRGGASDAAERASPCSPARSRNAARRGIGRRGGRVGAARRARLSRRHGHVRRGGRRKQAALAGGSGSPSVDLLARDGVKEGAGDAAAAAAVGADRASLRIRKLGQRFVAPRGRQRCVVKLVAAHDGARRPKGTARAQACLTISEMQLAFGEARGVCEQAGHRMTRAVRVLDALAQHHVAAALAVDWPRVREAREPLPEALRRGERAGMQLRITTGQPADVAALGRRLVGER